MPPSLDIYALVRRRDAATVNRFIDLYVDRARSEDRADEELMIVSLGASPSQSSHRFPGREPAYDWEPALTLTHVIERGLQHPRRAFTVYLSSRHEGNGSVVLCFTTDDQLILGLSIDDEGKKPETKAVAVSMLDRLMVEFDGPLGIILVEIPPPMSEAELVALQQHPMTEFFVYRQ